MSPRLLSYSSFSEEACCAFFCENPQLHSSSVASFSCEGEKKAVGNVLVVCRRSMLESTNTSCKESGNDAEMCRLWCKLSQNNVNHRCRNHHDASVSIRHSFKFCVTFHSHLQPGSLRFGQTLHQLFLYSLTCGHFYITDDAFTGGELAE